MRIPNCSRRWTEEKQIVADAVARMQPRDVEDFFTGDAVGVVESATGVALEASAALVKLRDPLTYSKLEGLSALDEFNEISLAVGEAMFLLGIEYARKYQPK